MDLQRAIEDGIQSMIDIATTNDKQCTRSVIGLYFLNLSKVGLWPLSDALRKFSVSSIVDKIVDLEDLDDDNSLCTYTCPCTKKEYIKPRVQEASEMILSAIEGLCLDCAKTDGVSSQEQRCRIPHAPEKWREV
jgi:hypothetical protein